MSSMFAWCFDAVVCLCVILAPCHSSFLLQASSVNAQLFTVGPAHHLAPLIALDLRLERERVVTHRETLANRHALPLVFVSQCES